MHQTYSLMLLLYVMVMKKCSNFNRHCVNIQNKIIRLLNEFKFKDRRFQVLYSRNISTLVFVFKQIAWYNGGQKFLRNITMIKPTEQ